LGGCGIVPLFSAFLGHIAALEACVSYSKTGNRPSSFPHLLLPSPISGVAKKTIELPPRIGIIMAVYASIDVPKGQTHARFLLPSKQNATSNPPTFNY
jgi:hypothetical protein